ncbi:MAG: sarcosine oxidase subunit gamma family protein [Hyphomicrobiaceae bacterium]|nr:sarcosine oxidase subunit gamma family protein [Hyphomicrobiaceae bacterium]
MSEPMSPAAPESSGLEGRLVPGRHGNASGPAGVTLHLCPPRALASVMARRGALEAAVRGVKAGFGLDLPSAPRRVAADATAFAWSGPGQWLAMTTGQTPGAFEQALRKALGASASVVDQSGGRLILRLAGPAARAVLAKTIPLDVHPRAFGPGDAASTLAGHIGVQLWQLDEAPTYEIAVMRSYAASLAQFLLDNSVEFGVEVSGAPPQPP